MIAQNKVSGVVLAGGQGRRMGGADKGLIMLRGRPMVHYAIDALAPLVDELFISANRNAQAYQRFGYPVLADGSDEFEGPLAGILSALGKATGDVLLVMPCDSPLLTADHLQRLLAGLNDSASIAVAFDGYRLHPVVMALKTHLTDDLAAYLLAGERKLQAWVGRHPNTVVDFSDIAHVFANINSAEDLAALEKQRAD